MITEKKPKFFSSPEDFRNWLKENHEIRSELWVGFYKKSTGIPSITWPESVDQALCFGWIDGIRKSVDEKSYMIRFTPRRPDSHWSEINIKKVAELKKKDLMHPAGLALFKQRNKKKTTQASYEQEKITLDEEYQQILKANKKAWKYFMKQPPSYQKQCIWWVMSAKKVETREKRLEILITSSRKNQLIPPLRWTKKSR